MKAALRVVCLVLALLGTCLPLAGTSAGDRGIGGTGAPAAGPMISDRGIGGTGIVGVITGFGSVFVDGLEVAYDPATPVTVDGEADAQAALRVGQLAAIDASDDHGLHAVSIAVQHEVSGPVTAVIADDGTGGRMLIVAGQRVAIGPGTEGLQTVQSGDWIAVSGLRQPDGVIAASRIDQRTPGTVLVRGPVVPGAGGWRIGDLSVRPPEGSSISPGENITAQGTIVNGTLAVATARPDVLGSNPAAFFGSHVRRMVIEGYVSGADGHVRLGRGLLATPGPGVAVPTGAHRAIVEFERGANGGFVATHLRGAGRPGAPHHAPSAPEQHGSLRPPRAAPHAVGPAHYRPHPWQNRHPGMGRGGAVRPHPGCGGGGRCRRNEGPR
ncbi:MAG TPA: DUF5666 domain-containing protein [Acetobacteraceae bacterium]|nr:DUF5666 domain-containing protein [Acetobacteraceae bacterium]